MYTIDNKDSLTEVTDLPVSSVGAPIPMIACDEGSCYLAYYIESVPEKWDGTTVRMMDSGTEGEQVALIKFGRCYAHMFGPPNDEAFAGHPLAERGLKPYSVFMVENSSWIRQAEQRNSVHEYHEKEQFMKGKMHYIFFFHDTTFECIAHSMECELFTGSVKSVLSQAIDHI